MRRARAAVLCALAACCLLPAAAADPPAETPAQRDARMQWWREARFGMFIHWGVYAVPAGYYQGKPVAGIGEWIMNRGKIPVAEYRAFAKQFNPVKYNPEAWVLLAKEAGMKYLVITSKHHDGFALFDTKASDWNVVKATPYGQDLLAPLAAACRKHGLKLGFYYSQAQDWNNPGGAAAGGHWDKAQDGSMDDYLKNVAVPQVREILTKYGPLAILWWDTPTNMTKERADLLRPLLALQPGIITNNRLGGGYAGDTDTPEQQIPATGIPGRDWETCMTMNGTWGYKRDDQSWKSVATLIRNLVDIASKGGNYLLNVGPTAEGEIPAPSVERLKAVGAWMKVNGEAIYATSASPFKRLPWGRATQRGTSDGTILYLHVFDWPADGKLVVPGLQNEVQQAWLLTASGRPAVRATSVPDGLLLTLPQTAPDAVSSTVALQVLGPLDIVGTVGRQAADGSARLAAADAKVHGQTLRYEFGDQRDNLGFWTDSADWAEWPLTITRPGRFEVRCEAAGHGGSALELGFGPAKLTVAAPNTGDYGKLTTVVAGLVDLPAGPLQVTAKPVVKGWRAVNLKAIVLQPAP